MKLSLIFINLARRSIKTNEFSSCLSTDKEIIMHTSFHLYMIISEYLTNDMELLLHLLGTEAHPLRV